VLGLMATSSRITREQAIWFSALSNISLVLFFLTQLAGARYLQRMLKPRSTRAGNAMQYVAVFLTGILFSLTGAIVLEAFGFAVLLRTGGPQ